MAAGIFSFYLTETVLFYKDVKPAFPRNMTTQLLDSTTAIAICGIIIWGLMSFSVLFQKILCIRYMFYFISGFGIFAMIILWVINIVAIGLLDYENMREVSEYASYILILHIFNIIFGFAGTVLFCFDIFGFAGQLR